MEKIVRNIEHSYVVAETRYIAGDGTEFNDEESCLRYEKELIIDDLKERGDIEVSYEVKGTEFINFISDPYSDDEEFVMFTPKTDEAAEALKNSCNNICVSYPFVKGESVCVRIRCGMPYGVMGAKEMRAAVTEWCRLYGRRVEFWKDVERNEADDGCVP